MSSYRFFEKCSSNRLGVVTLSKRLDYEQLSPSKKQISFIVKAVAKNTNNTESKSSTATIIIDVQDTNDNSPVFTQEVSLPHKRSFL